MVIDFAIKKKLDNFTLDVSYHFATGVLVIQGESGAGKSTILNCVSGLLTPDAGKIMLGDRVVFDGQQKINLAVQKRNIGYLFQNYALFPNMTVEKNILYGIQNKATYKDTQQRKIMLDYMKNIMDTFKISHLAQKYPLNISGGEKQRVALARAIVVQPDLLLLDEPFSALDIRTKEVVYQEFLEWKQRFAIPTIFISHDPQESALFGDVHLHLQQGRIISQLA